MKNCCPVTMASKLLVVVGALNWGLIGIFQWNLVNTLFGTWPTVERVVYALVGVAAVFLVVKMGMCKRECTMDHS